MSTHTSISQNVRRREHIENGGGALAEARRQVVRQCLPFDLDHGRGARFDWGNRGLTLAQRDRAVEELVAVGEVVIDASCYGISAWAARP
jgi:hypothetical protein